MFRNLVLRGRSLALRLRFLVAPRPFLDYRPVRRRCRRLGTAYGGWWVVPNDGLRDGLVVSAGAGEDISFDVALAREFAASVVIIDPTPRAVLHVEAVLERVGQPPERPFVEGGRQDPRSYDLSDVKPGQIRLEPVALWSNDGTVEFHPPSDPEHVSHSIADWRNSTMVEGATLRVPARRLDTVLDPDEVGRIALLKLDIEGAEIEVLESLVSGGCSPPQVCVEFDQLQRPSRAHVRRVRRVLKLLRSQGYGLARRERYNFSFVKL